MEYNPAVHAVHAAAPSAAAVLVIEPAGQRVQLILFEEVYFPGIQLSQDWEDKEVWIFPAGQTVQMASLPTRSQ